MILIYQKIKDLLVLSFNDHYGWKEDILLEKQVFIHKFYNARLVVWTDSNNKVWNMFIYFSDLGSKIKQRYDLYTEGGKVISSYFKLFFIE